MRSPLPYYELLMDRRHKWAAIQHQMIQTPMEEEFVKECHQSLTLLGVLSQAEVFKISPESFLRVTEDPHIPAKFEDIKVRLPYLNCYFEVPSGFELPNKGCEIPSHARLEYGQKEECRELKALQIFVGEEGIICQGGWFETDPFDPTHPDYAPQRRRYEKIDIDHKSIHETYQNVAWCHYLEESSYYMAHLFVGAYHTLALALAAYIFDGDTYYVERKKGQRQQQRKGHHKKKRFWYHYFHKTVAPPWEKSSGNGEPLTETQWVRGRDRQFFYCPFCDKNQSIAKVLRYKTCEHCKSYVGTQDKWVIRLRPQPTYARGPEREALMTGTIQVDPKKHHVKHKHPARDAIVARDKALEGHQ